MLLTWLNKIFLAGFNLFQSMWLAFAETKCLTPEVTRIHTQCFQNHCKVKFFSFLFHFHFSFTFFPQWFWILELQFKEKKITEKKNLQSQVSQRNWQKYPDKNDVLFPGGTDPSFIWRQVTELLFYSERLLARVSNCLYIYLVKGVCDFLSEKEGKQRRESTPTRG